MFIRCADITGDNLPLGTRMPYRNQADKEEVLSVYYSDEPKKTEITRDATFGYIASTYYQIYNSKGEPAAQVGGDANAG